MRPGATLTMKLTGKEREEGGRTRRDEKVEREDHPSLEKGQQQIKMKSDENAQEV